MIVIICVSSWVFNFVFLTYEANIPVQKCCQYLEDHLIHTFSHFFLFFFLGGPTIDLHIYVLKREPRRSEVYTFGPTFRAENSSQGTPAWGVFLGVFQAGGACGLKIFGRRLYNTLPKTNIAPENRPSQ